MPDDKQPFVDEKLYVNDATLEALRNEIESDVRRSLIRTVMVPLLAVGLLFILFGIFWLVPREIGTLLREDPLVNQRLRVAAEEYLKDPDGGKKIIRDQITSIVQADKSIQKVVEEAVQSAVSELNTDELVQQHVKDLLKNKSLSDLITEFLESDKGQTLLNSATGSYLDSQSGKQNLEAITAKELQSDKFRKILIQDLDSTLNK